MRVASEIRESCARKIKEIELDSIGCVGRLPGDGHPYPISFYECPGSSKNFMGSNSTFALPQVPS
jgi:hypothetical protein